MQTKGAEHRLPSGRIENLVDPSVIAAILNVPSFKHGSRSMQAVIDMCIRLGGEKERKFVSSTLPTAEQLDMYLDSAAFLVQFQTLRLRAPSSRSAIPLRSGTAAGRRDTRSDRSGPTS